MNRWASILAGAVVVSTAACHSHGDSTPPPQPEPLPAFRHQSFADTLTGDAEHFTFMNGAWVEHYGDAPFYGTAFYARAGLETKNADWQTRAQAARARNVGVIHDADFMTGDLQDMVTSTLGLIDAMATTRDMTELPDVDMFVDRIDDIVSLLGWYITVSNKSWALTTYGPTSVSALLGLVNAQYALLIGGPRKQDRIDWAVQMHQHISDAAWNEAGGFYLFGNGRTDVDLYPNVAMILFEGRLWELTRDPMHKGRALAIYQAIQPLKLMSDPTRYYSEYSAMNEGAKTRDFSTVSSQNYLMLALAILYEITGKAAYATEMDSVFDALQMEYQGTWCLSNVHKTACAPPCSTSGDVCVVSTCERDACNGALLHHWIDGRVALPTDPDFFCSGCNMQTLYALAYRRALTARGFP